MPERVKDLFDLPESVHKIGFVEVLSEAIRRPKSTAETYVVTDAIAQSFDKALRLVGTSLRDGRSQAAFLHGSFGSGKSHFMALLSLLLRGDEDAWRKPELHALREKHPFVGTKRLLELHFHMIGVGSLEEAVFAKYVDHVRAEHPGATVPGLFRDELLFTDMARLRTSIGDEKFFAPMNAAAASTDDDAAWGALAGSDRWDAARFERAMASEVATEREALFSALVKAWLPSYTEETGKYIKLDEGLEVIARHAKGLGYDGIVLFLDEVILWLASRASDQGWFHNEVQKLVKLVESQESRRDIPLVSFLARQRDLAEMVGRDYAGAESARLRESLQWSEGRYETIKLEDRNLPAIVEKRLLRPKGATAKQTLDEAFAKMRAGAGTAAWQTLLGKLDAADFRRLYPFSPALVDALVALSNSLQRERTAIKLLTEMLVEHIEDLEIGDVVGVGDLFDVLAAGEDSSEGIMKARFDSARRLYLHQFLPAIQQANGTTTPEQCQRLRPEHPVRLGCSNCAKKACRADNRLVKTMLIAALVPEVPALKDMTAGRLVQLNHGSLRVPIPGTEATLAASKLRTWGAQIGQLHVGMQPDPTVRVQLEGVDLGPILEQARGVDTQGARQRVLKELLFDLLGLTDTTQRSAEWGIDHTVEWRGTKRRGHVRFGNVRKLSADAFRLPEGHDWRAVVDYPFDDPGFGPKDDEAAIEKFREDGEGSWALVWLPAFFSAAMHQMLGELVVLEHVCESTLSLRQYVSHLSADHQTRAMTDLQNLREQKRVRVREVLAQAFGLAKAREGDLDESAQPESFLHLLKAGARLEVPLAAGFEGAIDTYVAAVLEARFPRHPRFGRKLTNAVVEDLVALFGELVDRDDKKLPAERDRIELVRGTLVELGLARTIENAVFLIEDRTLADLERKRDAKAIVRPEVSEVRAFIDEGGKMGLLPEAQDLIVRCYARWAARTFVSGGKLFEPRAGVRIPDHVVLEKPDLPTPSEWKRAIDFAGAVLGVAVRSRALHADALKQFEASVGERAEALRAGAERLPASLLRRLGSDESEPRLATARSGDALMRVLAGKRGRESVAALAEFEAATSETALASSLATARVNADLLEDDLVFGPFVQLRARQHELEGAKGMLANLDKVLRQDELNEALVARVRGLAREALALLQPATPLPVSPGKRTRIDVSASSASAARQRLAAALEQLERAVAAHGDAVALEGGFTIVEPAEDAASGPER